MGGVVETTLPDPSLPPPSVNLVVEPNLLQVRNNIIVRTQGPACKCVREAGGEGGWSVCSGSHL